MKLRNLGIDESLPEGVKPIEGSRLNKGPDGCVWWGGKPIEHKDPTEGLTVDTAMDYDEWKQAGYYIKKGSKSALRDALGKPQFTIEQVEKRRGRWR